MAEKATRRSARQKIQAEIFSPSKGKGVSKTANYSELSDGNSETSSDFGPKKKTAKRMPEKKANSDYNTETNVSSRSPNKTAISSPGKRGSFGNQVPHLFGLIKRQKISEENLDGWFSLFNSNRIAAMADLTNFILMCAGATKNWIQRDTDLEALAADEIDLMLSGMLKSMQQTEGSKHYPISLDTKESKLCRQRFVKFWEYLSAGFLSKLEDSDTNGGGLKAISSLRLIVDQLVTLSSMIVVNIRDVVTEATLTIGKQVSAKVDELRSKSTITNRQLAAETNKLNSSSQSSQEKSELNKKNKKLTAVSKEKTMSDKLLAALQSLVDNVFISIFIHRHRDFHEDIRASCATALGQWVTLDPEYFYKDEYLKYLGWLCCDQSHTVRRQAIRSIILAINKKSDVQAIFDFVEHFIERFTEIAVGDVDEECSLEMLSALRCLQNKGLLDFMSETQLDLIDNVVFDPQASLSIRQEALMFMMDHTQGFQEEDLQAANTNTNTNSNSTTKGANPKKNLTNSLAYQRAIALQLETLAEFAEHHVASNFVLMDPFIETATSLPQLQIALREWGVLSSLLLREGDQLTTSPLNDVQCSILLRLFANSALFVKSQMASMSDDNKSNQKGNKRSAAPNNNKAIESWDSLSEILINNLPRFLVRFRDDEENLIVLSDLLNCCDVSSSPQHQKSLKSLLVNISKLLATSPNEKLIEKLCGTLRNWLNFEGASSSQVESTIKELLSSCASRIEESHEFITSNKKRGKKSSSNINNKAANQNDFQDNIYTLSISITLFMYLWRNLDGRIYGSENLSNLSDLMVETADTLLENFDEKYKKQNKNEPNILSVYTTGLQNTARCLFNFCAWTYRDLFQNFQSSQDEAEEEDITVYISEILSIREKLVDLIHTWLRLPTTDDNQTQDISTTLNKNLQYTAFEIVGDLRLLFSMKLSEYSQGIDQLAWQPSKEFLEDLRKIFETEESRIRNQLLSLSEETHVEGSSEQIENNTKNNENAINSLSYSMITNLLQPLSQVMIYDTEYLNRRQAAAILIHITDPYEPIQKFIKEWIKKLKDNSMIKYLEIQLVTLKVFFEDRVLSLISKLKNEEEKEDDQKSLFSIEGSIDVVCDLSKRLSQTMGVGKVKGPAVESMIKFFILGMEYSFSNGLSAHLAFVRNLLPYIKFLPSENLKTVLNYFETHISESEIDLDDEFIIENRFDLSSIIQTLKDFRSYLKGSKINQASTRTRRKAYINESLVSTSHLDSVPLGPGVKSLEELDYEATQASISFDDMPANKRGKRQILNDMTKPSLGLHLEEIGEADEYSSEASGQKDFSEDDDFVPISQKTKKLKEKLISKPTNKAQSKETKKPKTDFTKEAAVEQIFGRGIKRSSRQSKSSEEDESPILSVESNPDEIDLDAEEIANWGKGSRRRLR